MKPSPLMRRQLFGMALFVSGTLLVGAPRLHAQQQQMATCTDWTDIQSWSGTITVSGAGQADDPVNNGTNLTTSVQGTISFTAPANFSGSSTCSFNALPSWVALNSQAIYSVNIHDVENTLCADRQFLNVAHPQIINFDVTNGTASTGNAFLQMDFSNPQAPTYSVGFGEVVDAVVLSSPGVPACNIQPFSLPPEQASWGPNSLFSIPSPTTTFLPATVSPLIGSATFQARDATVPCCPNSTWTVSWNFTPAPPDVDVVVTIPNYETWRPTGGRSETNTGVPTDIGNSLLIIQAQLIHKSTGQPALNVIPDKWSLQLVDSSHEPGVVMNWPAKQDLVKPSPPDMTFDKLINLEANQEFGAYLTISDNDTLAEIDNPAQTPAPQQAEALLVSFDWGGWATLNVTATVLGNPIKGHIVVNGQNVEDILLPLRQPGSFIADSWKNAHGIPLSTPDNDDSESNPKGDGQPGDGLTLYEEYRGFYAGCYETSAYPQPEGTPGAKCSRVEGDPKTKDFFVVNQLGDFGTKGIGLFQFGSGLNVHYRGLTLGDIGVADLADSTAFRAINFNHLAAPHVVNEHAVILGWAPKPRDGVSATLPTSDAPNTCAFLPKHTDHIEMDPTLPTRFYDSSEETDYVFFDTAVAHELSHSVDVCHHGDGVDHWEFWTLGPNNTVMAQRVGGINFNVVLSVPTAIVVDREDHNPPTDPTSQEILSLLHLDQIRDGNPTKVDGTPRAGRRVRVANCISSGQVVAAGGESSGDVLDVMRYANSEAYIPAGFQDSRILASDSASGVDLTDHPTGTGVNAPNRTPRPRYGDANPNSPYLRGNDRSQVDVNDGNTEAVRANFVCMP